MSKELPLISICVINYNNAEYLPDCVGSILAQSYPNIEIVFCDDVSTDNSIEVFDDIINQSPRKLKVNRQYRSTNGGLGGAYNCYTGAISFSGDYVCFLDSDDLLHPDHLQTLYKLIVQYNVDIAATDHIEFQNKNVPKNIPPIGKAKTRMIDTHKNIDQFYFQTAKEVVPFAKWHRLYSRSVFKDIHKIPEDFFGNSDSAYSIYCFVNAKRMVQADNVATYYYRILESSDSHASWYSLLKNRTYGSVTKLSNHYASNIPKLSRLNAARNNHVVVMMFNALVTENLPYREYRHTWKLAKANDFSFISDQLFGDSANYTQKIKLLRKTFSHTPLLYYLWKKRRSA